MVSGKEQRKRSPAQEQLRFPKTERIHPGDVRQFIRPEGIIRISFGQNPEDVNIEFDRFAPDKAAEERALSPFAEVLTGYVWDKAKQAYKKTIAGGKKIFYVSKDLKNRWTENA